MILLFLLPVIAQAAVIETSQGLIKGKEFLAKDGSLVHSFKHIPFAKPPVGPLRFALPQPAGPWEGIYDGRDYGPACMSNSSQTSSPQKWVDEDCLYNNIFVSDRCLKSKKGCPVVFYCHGGGFNFDSAVMFNDTDMVNNFGANDVVLVITAFRLGFFSLITFANDNIIPRNLPIYDIIESLRWVQKNIENYGGNRKSVTLMGHSGGGAAVASISFSKTIDPKRKKKSGPELLAVQRKMEDEGYQIQGMILEAPLFPTKDLTDFLANPPKLDLVIGSTLLEMDLWDDIEYSEDIGNIMGLTHPQAAADKYYRDKDKKLIKFSAVSQTQGLFIGNRQMAIEATKSGADVYLYSYRYPKHSSHTDDLSYIMGVHKFDMDENEKILSKVYPQYFINYIKTGVPDKEWEVFRLKDENYFAINVNVTTGLRPKNALKYEKEVIEYWTKNITAFDASFPPYKKKPGIFPVIFPNATVVPETRGYIIRENPGFPLSSILLALGLLICGIFIGRCTMPTKQRQFIVRLPEESTPLFYKEPSF